MLPRSFRIVILQLSAIIMLLSPFSIWARDSHIGIGSGASVLISKDPRFDPGAQFGYRILATFEKDPTASLLNVGAQLSYRSYEDSTPVSGVIYRGFRGISGGMRAVMALPFDVPWVDGFIEYPILANYSQYTLTQLRFFHLSAGIVPGLAITPNRNWDRFSLRVAVPVIWEPRRGTPLGVSGGVTLAGVYRFPIADKPE